VPRKVQSDKRKKQQREEGTAADLIPSDATLDELREIAAHCQACYLWRKGTQTVFGEGPSSAKLMFVGEQPGDKEDIVGHPFVGPAGIRLDRALQEAGIDRSKVYVTNVVKHFKWIPKGNRRLNQTPRAPEIHACVPWLLAEIARIKPQILVCLGAIAAKALLGNDFSVSRRRGKLVKSDLAPKVMATVHPSSLLRIRDEKDRHAETARFIKDLKKVTDLL